MVHHPHIMQALQLHQPIFIDDVKRESFSEQEWEIIHGRQLTSLFYFPLYYRGKNIGIFILGNQHQRSKVTPIELELFQTFANICAQTIYSQQMNQELRLFHTWIDTSHVPMVLVKPDGAVYFFNQNFQELLQNLNLELPLDHFPEILKTKFGIDYHDELIPALRQSGFYQKEIFVKVGSGNGRYFSLTAERLSMDNTGFLIAFTVIDITDLVTTQSAYKKYQQYLKRITDHMTDVVWMMDFNLNITFVSPSVEKLLGFSVQEYLRRSPEEKYPPEVFRNIRDLLPYYLPQLKEGKISEDFNFLFEFQEYTKDGKLLDLEANVRFLLDENHVPSGIIGVTRNISRSKKITDSLKKLTMELAQLSDREFFDSVCRYLAETLEFNLVMITKTDPEHGDIKPVSWFHREEVIIPEKMTLDETFYRELFKTDHVVCIPHEAYNQLNNKFPPILVPIESFICSQLMSKEGKLLGYLFGLGKSPVEDPSLAIQIFQLYQNSVTGELERIEWKRNILESEEKFRNLANSTPMAILLYQNDKWVYANPAATTMSGYSEEEILSMNFWDVVHPDDRPKVIEMGKKRQAGFAEEKQYEFRIIRKDGEIRWVYLYGTTTYFHGKPAGLITVIDITQRKKMEQEKEELQKQLLQAQKMESIGRLAGGIAHDFNNMLGVILGRVELLKRKLKDQSNVQKDISEIQDATERAAALTAQLLAFARKQSIQLQVLNLNESINRMLKILQRLIGEHIQLIWTPQENQIFIRMDPSHLDQILANLCVNARDAIPEGKKGKIIIETGITRLKDKWHLFDSGIPEGDYAVLKISDNGVGIPAENLSRIFDPFFTTKKPGEGTGLGLSTVYGLVKQYNGEIRVYSDVGYGTSFHLYFPLVPSAEVVSHTENEASISLEKVKNLQILLVEDEPALLEMITEMLKSYNLHVNATLSSEEAVAMVKRGDCRPDLLITDVVMPQITGKDLVMSIKEIIPAIRILYISGYPHGIIDPTDMKDRSCGFLQKPFTSAELLKKIQELMG